MEDFREINQRIEGLHNKKTTIFYIPAPSSRGAN